MCQARSIIDSPVASTTLAAAGITPSSSSIEIYSVDTDKVEQERARLNSVIFGIRGGISLIPAGYNPLGYALTDLGGKFLEFDGALECDVGRFLAGLKSGRKRFNTIKEQWLEVVRVSKKGQSLRIYRTLDDLIQFCLQAGFIN